MSNIYTLQSTKTWHSDQQKHGTPINKNMALRSTKTWHSDQHGTLQKTTACHTHTLPNRQHAHYKKQQQKTTTVDTHAHNMHLKKHNLYLPTASFLTLLKATEMPSTKSNQTSTQMPTQAPNGNTTCNHKSMHELS